MLLQICYYRLQGFLKTYIDKLNESSKFLKTKEGEEIAFDALKISTAWDAGEIVLNSGKVAWNAYKVVTTISKVKDSYKTVKAIKGKCDLMVYRIFKWEPQMIEK